LNELLGRSIQRSEELSRYTTPELIAEIRRQAAMRNATWPCVMLKDLLPLCDEIEQMRTTLVELERENREGWKQAEFWRVEYNILTGAKSELRPNA